MNYKSRTKVSRILIDESVPVNTPVTVLGTVRTARTGKGVSFLEINDGSCMQNIQAVITNPEKYPVLEKILTGASVKVSGKLIPSQGKGQKYEIAVEQVELVGAADATSPLQKKRHSF